MAELLILQKDDENLRFLKSRLKDFPKHSIYAESYDLNTSLGLLDHIHQIKLRELPIPDAIILDGNFQADSYPCHNAKTIINHHDELQLGIRIIGYSVIFLSQHDEINIHPGLDIGKSPNNLLRVLGQLFEQ